MKGRESWEKMKKKETGRWGRRKKGKGFLVQSIFSTLVFVNMCTGIPHLPEYMFLKSWPLSEISFSEPFSHRLLDKFPSL